MSAINWLTRWLIYRLSTRPSKQFLFMMLQRDGRLSAGKAIGLDLGCNQMANRPVFKTNQYIGVDLDVEALEKGTARFPRARAISARIEETGKYPSGDFVVCVQVFHTKHFDHAASPDVLRAVVSKVIANGTLLINFGRANHPYLERLESILRESFSDVRRTTYDPGNKETVFAPLIATWYLWTKPGGSERGDKTYFHCLMKK